MEKTEFCTVRREGRVTFVTIDRPETEIRIQVPRQPAKVIFNPDYAVLARTKSGLRRD